MTEPVLVIGAAGTVGGPTLRALLAAGADAMGRRSREPGNAVPGD
jgi:uncharacterized protein YbjT (DUF2867 family)